MSELLRVEKLSKYFPQKSGFFRKTISLLKAVDDVSFTLEEGKVLGIVGESGSGKSTLARLLVRLIEPTAGSIFFRGTNLLGLSKKELQQYRKKIQIVFQNPSLSLNPRKTVLETIGEVLRIEGGCRTKDEEHEKVSILLDQVGLEPSIISSYPHELSIGQKQRIAIARAISTNPELLILDECVSSLDISIQAQILNLLIELLQGLKMSYIFISHDMTCVEHISDDILVMQKGKVVEKGACEQVLTCPKDSYTALLVGSALSCDPRRRTIA
jgi:ABC-type oligopeptide transport system ATPase subunit